MRRTTITLTDGQERALAGLARPGPYQDELRAWARDRGIELNDSPAEAALVRLLIDAGIEHVRAHSAEVAYRELAEVYVDEGLAGEVSALSGEESASDFGGAPGVSGSATAAGRGGASHGSRTAGSRGMVARGVDRSVGAGGTASGTGVGGQQVARW